jgi:hypothetical protein
MMRTIEIPAALLSVDVTSRSNSIQTVSGLPGVGRMLLSATSGRKDPRGPSLTIEEAA